MQFVKEVRRGYEGMGMKLRYMVDADMPCERSSP